MAWKRDGVKTHHGLDMIEITCVTGLGCQFKYHKPIIENWLTPHDSGQPAGSPKGSLTCATARG